MPSSTPKAKPGQSKADIVRLKAEYIDYFRDVPVQKYAAMAIARDEDTIVLWKKNDPEFSDKVKMARAAWVRKKAGKVRAEFALERLEKDIWAERKEVTGKEGGAVEIKPVEIMEVLNGDKPKAKPDSRSDQPATG
jgi:hypothetical protein